MSPRCWYAACSKVDTARFILISDCSSRLLGLRSLAANQINALHRHCLFWASLLVQSWMIPSCFCATELCKGAWHCWRRLLCSWISSLDFQIKLKSDFCASALLWFLLRKYFRGSEFRPFPSVTAGDIFSSHFSYVSSKISHHAIVAAVVVFASVQRHCMRNPFVGLALVHWMSELRL